MKGVVDPVGFSARGSGQRGASASRTGALNHAGNRRECTTQCTPAAVAACRPPLTPHPPRRSPRQNLLAAHKVGRVHDTWGRGQRWGQGAGGWAWGGGRNSRPCRGCARLRLGPSTCMRPAALCRPRHFARWRRRGPAVQACHHQTHRWKRPPFLAKTSKSVPLIPGPVRVLRWRFKLGRAIHLPIRMPTRCGGSHTPHTGALHYLNYGGCGGHCCRSQLPPSSAPLTPP